MILKTKIASINNIITLEFGDGSIEIQGGLIPNSTAKLIMFKNCIPGTIGLSKSDLKSLSEFEPEIVMSFANKESFDAVYDYMTFMKNEYSKDSLK